MLLFHLSIQIKSCLVGSRSSNHCLKLVLCIIIHLFSTSMCRQIHSDLFFTLRRLNSTLFISVCMFLCVCRYAAAVQDGSQYFVLLIITDGVISDMAQTKEAIVNVRMLSCHKLKGLINQLIIKTVECTV